MEETYCIVDKEKLLLLNQADIREIKEADYNSIVNVLSVEIKKLHM